MMTKNFEDNVILRKSLFIILLFLLVLSSYLSLTPLVYYNILLYPIIGFLSFYIFAANFYLGSLFVFAFSFTSLFVDYMILLSIKDIIMIIYASAVTTSFFVLLTLIGTTIGYLVYNVFDKENKNMISKVILIFIISILTVGVIHGSNVLVGNPISRLIATNKAQDYLFENHEETDFYIDLVDYVSDSNSYVVYYKSEINIDFHFEREYSMTGKLISDNYSNVEKKITVYDRINEEYAKYVNKSFETTSLYKEDNIMSGELLTNDYSSEQIYIDNIFGLLYSDLIYNYNYDMNELGKNYGLLTVEIESDDISSKKISEYLVQIKKELDVNFNSINLTLTDSTSNLSTSVMYFKYSDIYEENLETRVVSNIEKCEELKNS